MKAKIDLEKFICSLMKRFYKIHNIDPLTTKCWLDKVLEDQGLEYRDGEIVEIPQDSEDERIRKELIENFKWFCGDFPETTKWGKDDNLLVKDIIAWLEKLGQQDDYDDNIITRDDEILQAISIGLADAEKDLGWSDFGGLPIEEIQGWLEKQSKPKWTDEDEERLQSCIIALQGKGLMGGVDTMDSKWLKSLKQRMEEQQ